jgi:LDH2 family malate/lactate/ureidoglycolate dehydrogenase
MDTPEQTSRGPRLDISTAARVQDRHALTAQPALRHNRSARKWKVTMAEYPGVENERRFPHRALQRVVEDVFQSCGMGEADAAVLAGHLVRADLRGIHSHGVMRVPDYARKLRGGGVDPEGRPRVAKDQGAVMVIDGGNAMGQIAGAFAMARARARAESTGGAAPAVGHSNHAGAMEAYVRTAVEAGMIGLATTNALPTMAPWGGIDKLVGLNPIGIGIPGGEEGPLMLDFAFGATAHGKMRIYQQKGLPIPPGWAFDRDGRPTTDIEAALEGLVQPIGMYKGIGLAMAMGVLSTLLSGAGYGTESGNMVDGAVPGCDGQFYLAMKVAAFEDPATFAARMDRLIREYKGTRLATGVERVWLPGEMEAELEARQRTEGVPLNEATITGILEVAAELGVDASALR